MVLLLRLQEVAPVTDSIISNAALLRGSNEKLQCLQKQQN